MNHSQVDEGSPVKVEGLPVVVCQRSNIWITATADRLPSHIVCPGMGNCPGGETYTRVEPAMVLFASAARFAATALGVDYPAVPIRVFLGEHPETKPAQRPHSDWAAIYVSRNVAVSWLPYEVGHEAAHLALGNGQASASHWSHEMIAVLISVQWTQGVLGTAQAQVAQLVTAAGETTYTEVVTAEFQSQARHLYGVVYVIGQKLIKTIGMRALRDLAVGNEGRPMLVADWRDQHPDFEDPQVVAFLDAAELAERP